MNINQNLSIDFIQSRVAFLRKLHPGRSVICAGGAIRDLLNKKPVKDLDFFIQGYACDFFENAYGPLRKEFAVDEYPHSHPKSDKAKLRSAHKDALKDYNECFMEILTEFGGGYGGPSYSDFWTVEFSCGWRNYPVQLVYLRDTDDISAECMDNFDFGLTRCWADDKRLRLTHDFHNDANNRRLTFYGSGWGETSEARLKRIREKYADWKYRDLSARRQPKAESVKPKAEGMHEPLERSYSNGRSGYVLEGFNDEDDL